tara:strand:- start:810 stop:1154 length:345 start_codon:yes stop_codon:yes gene_type:complete
MNKKGGTQKILFYIFFLVMAFLIIYLVSSYMVNHFDGTEFDKMFIAADVGLAIDSLEFSPAEIEMKYNLSKEYIIENKDSVLSIKIKDLEIPRRYTFISKIEDFSIKSDEIIRG